MRGQAFLLKTLCCLLLIIIFFINIQVATAQSGSNDPTFNSSDSGFGYGDGADLPVLTTAVQSDGKILIGGTFFSYNAANVKFLTRLDAYGRRDTNFISTATGVIYSIAIQGDGIIIVGGQFSSYNGTGRNNIARLNGDGTLDTGFDPGTGTDGAIKTCSFQSDGKIIIGGEFTTYNGEGRNNIARLNADGTLDVGFNPGTGTDGDVKTSSLQSDGKIVIGGQFANYNGTGRNNMARLNADGTLDAGFSQGTGPNDIVYTAVVQIDGTIIIGGNFSTYNGTSRSKICRINPNGTVDGTFSPGVGPSATVTSTATQGDGKIIIVGNFSAVGATPRNRIARLNIGGSLDASFNPGAGANKEIETSSLQSDGKIIIGGNFSEFDGTPLNHIGRIDSNGAADFLFNPSTGANSSVLTTAIQNDGKVIIGGFFTGYNGKLKDHIARLNPDGTLDNGFDAGNGLISAVYAIAIQSNGKIIVGGYSGNTTNTINRLNADGTIDASFNRGAGADRGIYSMALQTDGKIIIAGNFTQYNGTGRNYVARLNSDGTLDLTFNPGSAANGTIYTIALQSDGKIIIGGTFSAYNGTAIFGIARLNDDGSLDNSFNSGTGTDDAVYTAAIQNDERILIGGTFTFYNGTGRNNIARLNSDGSVDVGFNPGTGTNNSTVYMIIPQNDGKIIIGGAFSSYNGTARKNIARVNADGTLDASFDPGTGAAGSSIFSPGTVQFGSLQSDGKLIINGYFTSYDGIGRNRIARITTATGSLPLRLLNFNGSYKEGLNQLQWATSQEKNIAFFEVQRSTDGINFGNIGKVAANSNGGIRQEYKFNDSIQFLNTARYFYRLKIVDQSGSFTYSPVLGIKRNIKYFSVEVRPNPVLNFLQIDISSPIQEGATITMISNTGSLLLKQSYELQKGSNTILLPQLKRLPAGLYLLRVYTATQQQIIKVLKQ